MVKLPDFTAEQGTERGLDAPRGRLDDAADLGAPSDDERRHILHVESVCQVLAIDDGVFASVDADDAQLKRQRGPARRGDLKGLPEAGDLALAVAAPGPQDEVDPGAGGHYK